jgi:gamma-tubulin complex component 3
LVLLVFISLSLSLQGELEDPHKEFFVYADPRTPNSHLWQDKYSMRESMLPSFLPLDLAHKVPLVDGC